MDQALQQIIENDSGLIIPILLFIVCGIVGVVAIVFSSIRGMVVSKELERSRREIAAYIAEGSMTPEDGERLIRAGGANGKNKKKGSCWF